MAAYAPLAGLPQEELQSQQTQQNALAEYTRAAQEKAQTAQIAAQTQGVQQENQIRAQQIKDQDALTKTITQYDPAQHSIADIPKMVTANGGSGQAALQAQQGLIAQKQNYLKMTDEQFAQEQKKADLMQGVHDQVTQAAPEDKQNVYSNGLQHLSQAGVDVSNEPLQYPGDAAFSQHLAPIRLHSAIIADAEKDRQLTAQEQEAQAKVMGAQTTAQRLQAEMPGGPMEAPDKAELRSYLTDPRIPGEMLPPAQRTPASFVAWKAKQSPMAMVMGNQLGTGNALDQAAERYSTDGTLPSGFARSPGTLSAIINRSAELHPQQNLAANKATYQSDTKALGQVQKQFDVMNAFEGTALKNLDLYAQTAAKIPDLGARFANVPLRMITGGMIGTDNMAALNAARQTAASEVAKVLSSATGSGVLSDTQKKEAQDVIDGNLPMSATLAVVNTLKQDMANRHQSYQSDIDAIKGRLNKTQPATQTGNGMVTMKAPNGVTKQVPAAQVDHYKSLGATVVP